MNLSTLARKALAVWNNGNALLDVFFDVRTAQSLCTVNERGDYEKLANKIRSRLDTLQSL